MRRIAMLLALLLLLLVTAATASADDFSVHTAHLAPTSAGGPHGVATVQRTHTGDYKVTVTVWGLAPRSSHAMHFHRGTCAAQGPVIKPLPNITANAGGVGRVTTRMSEADWMMIMSAASYVNVHAQATPPIGGGITCGDVMGH